MKAKLTKNIECRALGFTILKGAIFDIVAIGKNWAICAGLPVTQVWNDEYELI